MRLGRNIFVWLKQLEYLGMNLSLACCVVNVVKLPKAKYTFVARHTQASKLQNIWLTQDLCLARYAFAFKPRNNHIKCTRTYIFNS